MQKIEQQNKEKLPSYTLQDLLEAAILITRRDKFLVMSEIENYIQEDAGSIKKIESVMADMMEHIRHIRDEYNKYRSSTDAYEGTPLEIKK